VAIAYRGTRPTKIVNFLYRDTSTDDSIPPHATFRLVTGDDPDQLLLYREDALIYKGDCEATAAELLMSETCHQLADRSQGGLLFHAAALTWQGKGLLMPGKVRAGKTTLTAWLVTRGFNYLTDELVFVPHGSDTMQTFTRPLNLKKPSRGVLQRQFDFEEHAAHLLSSFLCDLVPPTLLKPTNVPRESLASLIIFPRYVPDGDFSLRPLSGAQTGLALMEYLVNARNLPEHGFPEIARLARTTPAYKMSYGNFDQIGERIEALMQLLT
jgi:hypothetical protein